MSSKAKKMAEQVATPGQKTKEMSVRINVNISGVGTKVIYMVISGIPDDLPEEYEFTVLKSAEKQLSQIINQRTFIECYNQGKLPSDEHPVCVNLTKVDWLEIQSIEKV